MGTTARLSSVPALHVTGRHLPYIHVKDLKNEIEDRHILSVQPSNLSMMWPKWCIESTLQVSVITEAHYVIKHMDENSVLI